MYITKKTSAQKAKSDLQELIASIVLRQTDAFTLDDIIQDTTSQLTSPTPYAGEELSAVCANIVKTLQLIGCIRGTTTGKYALNISYSTVSAR